MKDWNVDLVRHFLLAAANQLESKSLVSAITAWQFAGGGVWIGIDESALMRQEVLFSTALDVVNQFGNEIPVDYLNENVKMSGTRWLKPQTTTDVVALIRDLESHLRENS